MKKILLFAMLCASLLSYATDVIVTTDNQKLEVKITAVTREQITYKMPDYLDGPDFTLSTSEINSIIFENGQVKTYDHSKPAPSSVSNPTTEKSQSVAGKYSIESDGRSFFRNGIRMNEKEYASFLKSNCPIAYDTYISGQKNYIAGLSISCVGLIFAIAGAGCSLSTLSGNDHFAGAVACYSVAGVSLVAATPCLCVGVARTQKSASLYNAYCGKEQTKLQFGISADENGLGLAIRF